MTHRSDAEATAPTPPREGAPQGLPAFTGDAALCVKCGELGAATSYRAAGEHGTRDRRPFSPSPKGERLERECRRCDYTWDEALGADEPEEPTPTRGDILADAFRGIASAVQRAAASTRDDFALAPPVDLTPRQSAAVRPLETSAQAGAGVESPEGPTGAQAGAYGSDAQAARWSRREQLGVLLSRMQRGVLLDAERPLLRAAVETELADADQAHADLQLMADLVTAAERARQHQAADADRYEAQLRTDLAEARAERDRARRSAVELENELAAVTDHR